MPTDEGFFQSGWESQGRSPVSFSDSATALAAAESHTRGVREVYRRAVEGFLRFCRERKAAATVHVAREFVDVARLEQAPRPGRLQEWKDALNWYFLKGKEAGVASLRGVPLVGRTDLGRSDWERALIVCIRTVQELLGHKDVATTQIYTRVMRKPGLGVRSPRDGG